jgi:hypothetical protein
VHRTAVDSTYQGSDEAANTVLLTERPVLRDLAPLLIDVVMADEFSVTEIYIYVHFLMDTDRCHETVSRESLQAWRRQEFCRSVECRQQHAFTTFLDFLSLLPTSEQHIPKAASFANAHDISSRFMCRRTSDLAANGRQFRVVMSILTETSR